MLDPFQQEGRFTIASWGADQGQSVLRGLLQLSQETRPGNQAGTRWRGEQLRPDQGLTGIALQMCL